MNMASWTDRLAPSVTTLIRMDHAHVLAIFQQFHGGTSVGKKEALVENVCIALEIHAKLEEEIFYPALQERAQVKVVDKSLPEHAQIRGGITRLRGMVSIDPDYDTTFMELMRDVMHHVADEETTLLPAAERFLPDRLHELGARMMSRRLQLMGSQSGEIASSALRSFPESAVALASGGVAAASFLFSRAVPKGWR